MAANSLNNALINHKKIALIGCALGYGGALLGPEQAPEFLQKSKLKQELEAMGLECEWYTTSYDEPQLAELNQDYEHALKVVNQQNQATAKLIHQALDKGQFPIVMGGNHAMAVGTWSAISQYFKIAEQLGMIWFDAHLDAHLPHTSPSDNLHGMPVAALMGQGDSRFIDAVAPGKKIRPEHLVHLGVRCFEEEEQEFLEQHQSDIVYMQQLENGEFATEFKRAIEKVSADTQAFGISLDLDGFDPHYAPGVSCPVSKGLHAKEVLPSFEGLIHHPKLIGLEIVEYNPKLDQDNKTLDLIIELLKAFCK